MTGQEPFGHIVSENTYSRCSHSMSGKESIHHSPLVEGTNNQAEVLHPSLLPPRDRAQEQRGGQASLQAVPGTWVENGRTSFSVLGQVKRFATSSFRAAKKFSPPRNATTAVARTLVCCFVFFSSNQCRKTTGHLLLPGARDNTDTCSSAAPVVAASSSAGLRLQPPDSPEG